MHESTTGTRKQSFFEGMNAKSSFFFGLISGIAAVSLIGFLVTVSMVATSKKSTATTTGRVAGDSTNTNTSNSIVDPSGDASKLSPVSAADHQKGPEDAPVTLVEYTDFQCPYCQQLHPTLERLMTEYDGKIRWVVRQFPLTSIHPQAQAAAIASECVAELGGNDAFWSYADTIFGDQSKLADGYYAQVAKTLGISESKFNDCVSSGKYTSVIQNDISEATAAGVRGTPATFVNGRLISGALPYDQFKSVIDSLL